ncbi:TIGR00730 family Rossman fold protein [Xanthocytophaga agilis]|uniref:Cytokinin riboside 5'-monophosphate phosphoribohydrolase n=1 Tax=Xanthocytophaga agilis TaxID=3048010 RepID=A0AAE3QXY8_9BACT|nr:TIGR00730 family Rossman fold protein [Xanthocytophaga agilis]MDJ1500084.1 TIGR00730 family Rossman fold protein [Xanthocytophaga agilis]
MQSICVFCASGIGKDPQYAQAAQQLGKLLAAENIRLIYGGSQRGLMGEVANAVLANGGKATGVLPDFLATKEIAHTNLTELIRVNTMHDRKSRMADLAEGFIAMPGGFGTMDELCEILTWAQLGLHRKPIAIWNINGYYDALITLFDRMAEEELLKPINRRMVLVDSDLPVLIEKMRTYQAPSLPPWLSESQI